MKWSEIRVHYPDQWLLAEAINARSEAGKRIIEDLAVLESYSDSTTAMNRYSKVHREMPERELYVLHTSHEQLDIVERPWFGIRSAR